MLNKIREKYQFSECELEQIDQKLINYIDNKISLKDLLIFFEIKKFSNWFYDECHESYKELINPKEAAIISIFAICSKSIFEYDIFKKWQMLYDYITFVFVRNPLNSYPVSHDGKFVSDDNFDIVFNY